MIVEGGVPMVRGMPGSAGGWWARNLDGELIQHSFWLSTVDTEENARTAEATLPEDRLRRILVGEDDELRAEALNLRDEVLSAVLEFLAAQLLSRACRTLDDVREPNAAGKRRVILVAPDRIADEPYLPNPSEEALSERALVVVTAGDADVRRVDADGNCSKPRTQEVLERQNHSPHPMGGHTMAGVVAECQDATLLIAQLGHGASISGHR